MKQNEALCSFVTVLRRPACRLPTGGPMHTQIRTIVAVAAAAATLALAAPQARADVSYYTPPQFKNRVAPVYTDTARAAHETGTVILKVLVGADGKAKQFIVFKSSGHKDLDDAVMAAAKASTYEPATRGTSPTVGFLDVTYNFTLSGVAENAGTSADLAKKLDANPHDSASRLVLATDDLNQKNFSDAENLLQQGTQVDPSNAKIWEYLGLSYYQDAQNNPSDAAGKYKQAADAYDKALSLNPNLATKNVASSTYFNEGFQLQQNSDYTDAMTYANKAVSLDPKSSENYILLGEVQTGENDFADAITTLKKAESLDNKQSPVVTARIVSDEANAELEQGDKVDGMNDIHRAEQVDPSAQFPYEYLETYYIKSGNKAAALTPLTQLTELDPKNPVWQAQIGSLYLGENNPAAAKDAFQKALALDPTSTDAQFGMAELSAQQGDSASVATAMQKLTANATPKQAAAYDATIAVLLINASTTQKPMWDQAVSYATQATTADPNNGQGWYALGTADAQLKKTDDANNALKKAYGIFKAQNNQDMIKAVNDMYHNINGSDISG